MCVWIEGGRRQAEREGGKEGGREGGREGEREGGRVRGRGEETVQSDSTIGSYCHELSSFPDTEWICPS